jgi:hypothetical protein
MGVLRIGKREGYRRYLNPVQVQKWSFALEKTPDLELDLV